MPVDSRKRNAVRGGVLRRAALATLLGSLLVVGCTGDVDSPRLGSDVEEADALAAIDELMAFPSAETLASVYEVLGEDVRKTLDELHGGLDWVVDPPAFTTGVVCGGQYVDLEGRSVTVRSIAPGHPLEGSEWESAVESIAAVVAPHGFTERSVLVDRRGAHQVVLVGERGATVSIYSNTRLEVRLQSACYLRDSDRDAVSEYGVPDPGRWARLYPDSTALPDDM